MAAQGTSQKNEIIAMAAPPPMRALLPMLIVAALACAGLIYFAVGQIALAAGFAAALIAVAALGYWFTQLFPKEVLDLDAIPDWTVARAAADASSMAIAVTDRSGRLVCASDLFGEWFPGFPTPPGLPLDPTDAERLTAAGRAAWSDGEGKASGIGRGALLCWLR